MTQEPKERSNKVCVLCNKQFPGSVEVCPDDGMLLTPVVKEPKEGDIFAGRYEILGVIGDGGMGKVYKAKHSLMKRVVAIKMLLPHLVQNAAALKRFTQEAQAASALKHPHILYVHDFGISDDGIPYLVMDFLEGVNLSSLLQEQGSLSEKRTVNIFLQACSALAHAHSKGVIHRDIKPANIMLINYEGQEDYLQIVDFGIAKLLQPDGSEQLTQTGEVFGSPLYMSPEQCRGKELDARSDIYSLGCVLYRAISGHPVFSGRDAMECMYKQVNEEPCKFSEISPELGISPELEAIVFKAIAKDPDQRFQSMQEFKAALDATQEGTGEAVEKIFAVPPKSSQAVSHEIITDKLKASGSEVIESTQTNEAVPPETLKSSQTTEKEFEGAISGRAHMNGSSLQQGSGQREQADAAAPVHQENPAAHQQSAAETAKIELENQTVPDNAPPPAEQSEERKTNAQLHPAASAASLSQAAEAPPAGNNQGKIIGAIVGVLVAGILAIFFFNSAKKIDSNSSGSSAKGGGGASSLVSTANSQLNKGDFKNAEQTLHEAASAASDDQELMEVLPKQALVYEQSGKFAKAQESWTKLKDLQEKHSAKATDIARSKAEIAENMLEQNNLDGALPLLSQAEKTLSAAPAKDNEGLAGVWSALSKAALKQGDYNQAVDYLQKAIARKSAGGALNDPELAHYYQDLAVIYLAQGKFKEAEKTLQRVLKIYDQNFGADSAQAADTYKFLATMYFQENKLAQAENLFKKSLSIKNKHFGENSLGSAEVMTALAMLYTREKKYAQAEPLFKSALEIRSNELGPDSPQAVRTKDGYAKMQKLMSGQK